MKRVLIAGTGPDPHHVFSGCVLALGALGLEAVQSMEAEDLEGCSGLILPGGVPDVDPARYGEPLAGSLEVTPELDRKQFALLERAVEQNLPVLGICRGCQVVNVYFGGSLIQDLETGEIHRFHQDREVVHDTVCIPGTFAYDLYGAHAHVNTKHHQALRRLAPEFGVAQLWFDGSIPRETQTELIAQAQAGTLTEGTHRCILEGIYHRTRPILALQWHPELLVDKPLEGTVDPMAVFRHFDSLL